MALLDIISQDVGTERPLRLGVALSGGADSVALLHALKALGHNCVALHCNFHLRGDESDRDEQFCRDLCDRLGVELLVHQCDVAARQQLTGESVEMAARALRYAWFETVMNERQLDRIAVGHHREDNIETFFLNLLRGSGINGLAAMRSDNGRILRPMLQAPKALILEYIATNGLEYVTDSTNASTQFKRNRLRHRLLPLIEENFPGGLEAIARAIDILRQQSLVFEADTQRMRTRYVDSAGNIDVAAIVEAEPSPSDALYRLLAEQGVTADMIANIVAEPLGAGRRFGTYELRHGKLLKSHSHDPIDVKIELVTLKSADDLKCAPNQLLLNPEGIDPSLLTLRNVELGDRIAPFGMRGTKLVSDILTERNIPLNERSECKVLTYKGEILWVVGLRASRHYAIPKDATFPLQALRVTQDPKSPTAD